MEVLKKEKDTVYFLMNSMPENDGNELYRYIGSYVMSRQVIDEMGGYPFYDTPTRWWLIVQKYPAPNTQTIAFSSFSIAKMSSKGTIEIMDAFVSPKHRNRGFYRTMLQIRLDYCLKHYKPKAFEVLAMPSTQGILSSIGFAHISTRGRYWRMIKEVGENATNHAH